MTKAPIARSGAPHIATAAISSCEHETALSLTDDDHYSVEDLIYL